MAPEMFSGAEASASSDLYAAGATLYHLLTRKYPYGEIEPFQHPRFTTPAPPSRYRPDIPLWLENVILRACAREPRDRYETAEEFLLALERGEANRLGRQRPAPLAERDPAQFWQAVAIVSLIVNLLLLYVVIVG
jgi:serine/threonine protein kinase